MIMIKLLQKTLDRFMIKMGLQYRYIIRFYCSEVNGFGGLKNGIVELYKKKGRKTTNVFSLSIKGKSDEMEELACVELMSYLINTEKIWNGTNIKVQ